MTLQRSAVLAITGLAAFALSGVAADAATLEFTAGLDGAQEVPPVSTDAEGEASIFVDTDLETIDFTLNVVGLSLDDLNDGLVAAPLGPVHLHNASAGINGLIVIPFAFDATTYSDTADGFEVSVSDLAFADAVALSGSSLTFDAFVTAMLAGEFYVNVHTDAFGGGEIRGQISAVPLPGAMVLFLAGAAGLGFARRRQRR